DAIRFLIRTNASSTAVKAELEKVIGLKAKVTEALQEVAREDRLLKVIEQDQARMRANMQAVPQTSEAYKRYVKKFDEQATEIETRREKIAKLNDKADEHRRTLDTFLANLTVE